MKKLTVLAGVLLVVLVVAAAVAPVALAQDITGDKIVMGENYVLGEGQTLEGNLVVMGGNAQVNDGATVDGDVTVMGGMLTLDGTVTGNVAVVGGTARLGSTAVVEGNLSSFGGSVSKAPGAQVQGNTFDGFRSPNRFGPSPVTPAFAGQNETPGSWFGRFVGWQFGTLGSILLMGLLGVVLVLVAPRGVGRVASATAVQPALTFVFGLLTLVLGILAGAILLLACGLGLLVFGALLAAWVLGWIGVALWLGQRVLRAINVRSASSIAEVLAGVVIITFLSRLPCIGWVAGILFASWGIGAVVLTRFGTRDADAPGPRPAPAPRFDPAPPAPMPGGGTGGGFAPLPETSELDLAAPPIVPPVDREAPLAADVVAADAAAADVVPVDEAFEFAEPAVEVLPAETVAGAALTQIAGIDADLAARLEVAGIRTVADLAVAHPVELAAATGVPVGQIMTEDWIGQAQRLL